LREKELETAARDRERALSDARAHLATMMKMMQSDRALLRANEIRIGDLQAQVEDYRQQLAKIVARAVARNRAVIKTKTPEAIKAKKRPTARRRATSPKTTRRPSSRSRSMK
jgi:hypothetical protein